MDNNIHYIDDGVKAGTDVTINYPSTGGILSVSSTDKTKHKEITRSKNRKALKAKRKAKQYLRRK